MSDLCVVSLEGVLAYEADLNKAAPTRHARDLYEGLRHRYRLICLTLSDHDTADWWLRRELMPEWAGIMTKPDGHVDYEHWRTLQIGEFLAEGWDVGMVIDTSAAVTDALNEMGLVTMLLSYPRKRIGWQEPAEAVRPWNEAVQYDAPQSRR